MLRSALLKTGNLIATSKTLASFTVFQHPYFFSTQAQSSVIHDLTTAHGFPHDVAKTVASLIEPKLPKTYNSVLALLREYGFSHSDISAIAVRSPHLLYSDAAKNLKPKLDALARHGVEGPTLVQVITNDPYILRLSLDLRLLPCLQGLARFFGQTKSIVDLFLTRRGTWILHKFTDSMEGNIETLRRHGVSDENIAKMITIRPRTLCRDAEEFRQIVKEVNEMGIDFKSSVFVHGVVSRAGMKRDKWASKLEVFRRFGWTEGEIRRLLIKVPKVMEPSTERMEKSLEYFMKQLGWTKEEISNYPTMLFTSMENKIIPRMAVLRVLLNEGLIRRKSVPQAFLMTQENFLENFVVKYRDRTKQLLEVYQNQNKASVDGFSVVKGSISQAGQKEPCL